MLSAISIASYSTTERSFLKKALYEIPRTFHWLTDLTAAYFFWNENGKVSGVLPIVSKIGTVFLFCIIIIITRGGDVLLRMQKAVISHSLNIARTFKVLT